MNMSFKEKSAWISFISTLCIFGYYFYQVWSLNGVPHELAIEAAKILLGKAIILSIVVEVIFHSMLAATNHKAAAQNGDERDRLFEYRANELGYTVLVIGVMATLGHIILKETLPTLSVESDALSIPLFSAHILMFSFILSELVRFAGQIYFHRRGI